MEYGSTGMLNRYSGDLFSERMFQVATTPDILKRINLLGGFEYHMIEYWLSFSKFRIYAIIP
jgi:hypothetical protein